ncbi:MAG: hypothetical protein LZF61_01075 [Nitrosomonas sp.]|nr:MAG: hypothetical protein LZF61_01075 [Nitrosomonas sp.]
MQTKLFFAVLMIVGLLASGLSMAIDDTNVEQAEANAQTRFDHIELAEYYENEAKAMKEKAKEQKKLLNEYNKHMEYYGREGQDFHAHHSALFKYYTEAAERNAEMAVSHRNIAKPLKN